MKSDLIIRESIRCIIVDDEDLVRERFRVGFPLLEHGFEVVGEAEDGEEALELCKQLNPDIVITDIVMPRMDGLQLTEQLKRVMPRAKVIILSNYQEFDFARKAVQLGAIGYLLKVTSGHRELLELLDKARKEIEADREQLLAGMQARHRFQQSKPLLQKQFMLNVMNQLYATPEAIRKECELLELRPPAYGCTIAYLEIDKFAELQRTYHSRDISLFRYVLMQMIEEVCSAAPYQGNLFPWRDDHAFLLWLHWDSAYAFVQAEAHAHALYQKINAFIKQYLPFTVTCCFSLSKKLTTEPSFLASQLKTAVQEAVTTGSQRFYQANGRAYTFAPQLAFKPLSEGLKQELNNSLQSLNPNLSDSELRGKLQEEVLAKFVRQQVQPSQVLDWLKEVTAHWTANEPLGATVLTDALDTVEMLQDVEDVFVRLLEWKRTIQVLSSKDIHYRTEIQGALDYIHTHFHKPISVTDVCRHLNISPNYFSHLFKVQTGSNFSDYVTHYRMQAAKNLLKETTLQVQEISERVGIADYKYFTRLFRRSTGQTPSSFREQAKQ